MFSPQHEPTLDMADVNSPCQASTSPTGSTVSIATATDYFQSLGPWTTQASVANHLRTDASELALMVERDQVLGVRFADGRIYFPCWQFNDSGLVAGVAEVLGTLMPAFAAPETCAAWLVGRIYEEEAVRYIDELREGRVEQVLQWARKDAARVLR